MVLAGEGLSSCFGQTPRFLAREDDNEWNMDPIPSNAAVLP